jgi:hypothetical protein
MTTGRFLIDITDERFRTPQNAEVIEFIRSANPFAHSDLGSLLFRLAKGLSGATAYCPLASQCAYVALHNQANVIFAIAFDMHDVAFRLSSANVTRALAAEGSPVDAIGAEWVRFNPWTSVQKKLPLEVLEPWAARACTHSFALS